MPRDRLGGRRVQLHVLGRGDRHEMRREVLHREAPEIEPLTPADDRRRHLVRFGGRQHEPDAGRRLFEQLEERVERFARQPLRLVDDVDLLAPDHRRGGRLLAEVARVVHPAVRRGVDLDHVNVGPVADRDALLADAARLGGRRVHAVDHLGQDPRGGGLAGAPRPAEQERVRQPPFADGTGQGSDDVVLADQLGGRLRPVPSVQGLVVGSPLAVRRHARSSTSCTMAVHPPSTT